MEKPNKTYKNVFLPPKMTAVRFLVNQIRYVIFEMLMIFLNPCLYV